MGPPEGSPGVWPLTVEDALVSWGPWLAVLLGSLLAALVFLPYCLQYREQRGATPLAVMFVGIAIWLVSEFVQVLTAPSPAAGGGLALRMLGVKIVVIGVLLLGLEYTGREHLITRWTVAAVSVEPVVTVAVALVRPDALVEAQLAANVPWGYEIAAEPLWMVTVVYSYLLMVAGLGLLTHMMLRATYANRWRIFALMVAIFLPLAFNSLFYVGVTPFDFTPGSFLVTAVVLMYATFRWRLMDPAPVARRTVIEQMEDLVFVLDEQGRVTTVNAAVTDCFDADEAEILDEPVEALLDDPSLANPVAGEVSLDLTVDVGGESREFDISKSVLTDYRGDLLAQVVVCRDVTEKRRREEQLELLKDVQSRFLRHNLRNELNTILAHAEFMRDDTGPPREESYEVIVETSERLIEWGEKARTIERLVESSKREPHEVGPTVRRLVTRVRERYPDVEFRVDCPDALWAMTVPQVDTALENLLDNAARYNTGPDPCVEATVTAADGAVRVVIADNGPGIDRAELDAIQAGEETQLEHSSGFGLWLAYWVVDSSGGDIEFETGDGTTVTLVFDRADAPRTVL
jgi:PAS domain S-box-containing protein